LQDGFHDFVGRCEGAEFEDAVLAQQGKMSLRDLQKMRQSAGNQYATKPASELAMDNREAWEVLTVHLQPIIHAHGCCLATHKLEPYVILIDSAASLRACFAVSRPA